MQILGLCIGLFVSLKFLRKWQYCPNKSKRERLQGEIRKTKFSSNSLASRASDYIPKIFSQLNDNIKYDSPSELKPQERSVYKSSKILQINNSKRNLMC